MERKSSENVIKGRSGQHYRVCRQCHPDWEQSMWPKDLSPLRALYIRVPHEGFKRIGWYFEKCSHMEIDKAARAKIKL